MGDVIGSALTAEGIFAFFLESGSRDFGAIWIVGANSWQQTLTGYVIEQSRREPRAVIADSPAMVFNPSSIYRLPHTICGSWQASTKPGQPANLWL